MALPHGGNGTVQQEHFCANIFIDILALSVLWLWWSNHVTVHPLQKHFRPFQSAGALFAPTFYEA